jgi:hypothetical protein
LFFKKYIVYREYFKYFRFDDHVKFKRLEFGPRDLGLEILANPCLGMTTVSDLCMGLTLKMIANLRLGLVSNMVAKPKQPTNKQRIIVHFSC